MLSYQLAQKLKLLGNRSKNVYQAINNPFLGELFGEPSFYEVETFICIAVHGMLRDNFTRRQSWCCMHKRGGKSVAQLLIHCFAAGELWY